MLPLELGDRLTSQCFGTEAGQQEEGWKLKCPFSSVALDGIKLRREAKCVGTTHAHVSCWNARIFLLTLTMGHGLVMLQDCFAGFHGE